VAALTKRLAKLEAKTQPPKPRTIKKSEGPNTQIERTPKWKSLSGSRLAAQLVDPFDVAQTQALKIPDDYAGKSLMFKDRLNLQASSPVGGDSIVIVASPFMKDAVQWAANTTEGGAYPAASSANSDLYTELNTVNFEKTRAAGMAMRVANVTGADAKIPRIAAWCGNNHKFTGHTTPAVADGVMDKDDTRSAVLGSGSSIQQGWCPKGYQFTPQVPVYDHASTSTAGPRIHFEITGLDPLAVQHFDLELCTLIEAFVTTTGHYLGGTESAVNHDLMDFVQNAIPRLTFFFQQNEVAIARYASNVQRRLSDPDAFGTIMSGGQMLLTIAGIAKLWKGF